MPERDDYDTYWAKPAGWRTGSYLSRGTDVRLTIGCQELPPGACAGCGRLEGPKGGKRPRLPPTARPPAQTLSYMQDKGCLPVEPGWTSLPAGCNGQGRIPGGMTAILAAANGGTAPDWWPIKIYRPCPLFVESGKVYESAGQVRVAGALTPPVRSERLRRRCCK
jgi:hypothetical protein